MKKCNGNTPSAYQTISQFCEEGSFNTIDNDTPISIARNKKFSFNTIRLLIGNPLRRRRTDIPG